MKLKGSEKKDFSIHDLNRTILYAAITAASGYLIEVWNQSDTLSITVMAKPFFTAVLFGVIVAIRKYFVDTREVVNEQPGADTNNSPKSKRGRPISTGKRRNTPPKGERK